MQNEQELKEYKRIVDEASIVSKANLKGVITYVNSKFCLISGYSKEELIGQKHNIVRSPNMPKEAFADLWSTIKAKKIWRGIVENRAKDGSSYFVKSTVMPILNKNNEIVEYISLREDITELKKHQLNQLHTSVDNALDIKWKHVVEYIPVPTVILDKNSIVKFSNNLFNDEFTSFKKNEKLDSLFEVCEGYIFSDDILDWKDVVVNSDFQTKALIGGTEYVVSIKKVEKESFYVVSFCSLEDGF